MQKKIHEDLLAAMRAGDKIKTSTLRMLLTSIRNREVTDKLPSGGLNDDAVLAVVSSEIKKRKDSIAAFQAAGRQELAGQEEQESAILSAYLPPALSEGELEDIVKKIVAQAADKNFGKVMGQVMGQVKGKADGNQVSAMVKKILG